MRRPETNSALRVTNDRQAQRRKRLADYRRRAQVYREERLAMLLVRKGVVRRWC